MEILFTYKLGTVNISYYYAPLAGVNCIVNVDVFFCLFVWFVDTLLINANNLFESVVYFWKTKVRSATVRFCTVNNNISA